LQENAKKLAVYAANWCDGIAAGSAAASRCPFDKVMREDKNPIFMSPENTN
jgi:hypothetical protein